MRQFSTKPTPNDTIRPLDHGQTVAHHLEVGQTQLLRHFQPMQKRHPLCITIPAVAQIIADEDLPPHNGGNFNRAGVGAAASVKEHLGPPVLCHKLFVEHDNRARGVALFHLFKAFVHF